MPYIRKSQRDSLGEKFDNSADTAGELNYQITALIKDYLKSNGKNYQHINDILGALEGAKIEFYRRVVVPYEDLKCKANGDVY